MKHKVLFKHVAYVLQPHVRRHLAGYPGRDLRLRHSILVRRRLQLCVLLHRQLPLPTCLLRVTVQLSVRGQFLFFKFFIAFDSGYIV